MPIEKRPASPLPKGIRPGSRYPPYKVTDADSLETVAQKYMIGVTTLIKHNFDTMDPAEINWYLREHVGCNKPTSDGKNWCFSSTAKPGLIYIPGSGGPPPDGGEIGITPPQPPGSGSGSSPFGLKINPEYQFPARDAGYFRLQFVLAGEGVVQPEQGSPMIEQNGKTKVTYEVSKNIAEQLAGQVEVGFTRENLTAIADAVKQGNKRAFAQEIARLFQVKLAGSGKFKFVNVKPSVGVEMSTTPAVFEIWIGHEDRLVYQNSPYKYSVALKLQMKVGLSAKGWQELVRRIGVPAVRAFVYSLGAEAAAAIASWAGFALLGAGAAIATTFLFGWLIENAHRVGDKTAAGSWYARHYTNAVFYRTYTTLPSHFSDNEVAQKMIELAGLDLIADMRRQLIEVPNLNPVPYRENEPGFWGPAADALRTYARYAIAASDGNNILAEERMAQAARNKAWERLGV
jgi:hypothetical protein